MLQQLIPYFGYLASLSLIIALLVSNDLKFRWFNSFGSVFFIIYAIVLHAFPVLLTNVILLGINVYCLIKIYSKNENFDLLEFKKDDKLVEKFLMFYRNDIETYFPAFEPEMMANNLNFVVIRDLVIANIFSATITQQGDAVVVLNYTVKKYRDYKVGTFIFEKERDYLISKGIKRIAYNKTYNKRHRQFLTVMGFKRDAANDECYIKKL